MTVEARARADLVRMIEIIERKIVEWDGCSGPKVEREVARLEQERSLYSYVLFRLTDSAERRRELQEAISDFEKRRQGKATGCPGRKWPVSRAQMPA